MKLGLIQFSFICIKLPSSIMVSLNIENFDIKIYNLSVVWLPLQRFECKWSDQAAKLSEGTVPLPLLAAIHAKDKQSAQAFHGVCLKRIR